MSSVVIILEIKGNWINSNTKIFYITNEWLTKEGEYTSVYTAEKERKTFIGLVCECMHAEDAPHG